MPEPSTPTSAASQLAEDHHEPRDDGHATNDEPAAGAVAGDWTEYLVRWEVDVTARSPREAAELALDMQRGTGGATVFDVRPHRDGARRQRIDLDRQDTAAYCRFCGQPAHRRAGTAEPGTNPWCCDNCWDERLR
jgi:hypothetical protein